MAAFTKTHHSKSYAAIDPTLPAHSQAGRTVMVMGASEGIGYAVAQSFAWAGADRVIITGRRAEKLDAAAASLRAEKPGVEVDAHAVDVCSERDVAGLWRRLAAAGRHVDVLVLSAASMGPPVLTDPKGLPLMSHAFEMGVVANMRLVDAFLAQDPARRGPGKQTVVNISSAVAHASPLPYMATYGAVKVAMLKMMQHLAEELGSETTHVVSFHPGAILTAAARESGFDDSSMPWDDVNLAGDFCVWAASPDAYFLHGKFAWAAWDVPELMSRKEEIANTNGMLLVGIHGIPHGDMETLFQKTLAKAP